MKLLYYIPAFGKNNLDVKYDILIHNLTYIYNNINTSFDICINFYTVCDDIKLKISSLHFINKLYVYEKEGILTELFLTNPNNKYISNYDYVLFVLDDVKIKEFDVGKMIEVKKKYKIEFLSPKIVGSTHHYFMNAYTDLTINNFLEVYLLLFTPVDFTKFCGLHTIKNKWMWGIDFLFGHYKIKTGVLNRYVAEHVLPSESDHSTARPLMDDYFKTRTPYTCLDDIIKSFPPIKETIIL